MRSTEKTVLYARHTDGKTHVTYPVGVFNSPKSAAAFKTHLNTAHNTGDVEATRKLAPAVKTTEAGTLHSNIAFAMLTLPYEPTIEAPEVAGESFEL